MSVIYNGQKIIPAPPNITVSKRHSTTPDGRKLGSVFVLTMRGTIVAFMGSPDSSGTFWTASGYPPDEEIVADKRLAAITRKQEALRRLFASEGHQFEWQTPDGTLPPAKCNPTNISIEFQGDIWYNRCDYTVTMEANKIYGAGDVYEDDLSDGLGLFDTGIYRYIEDATETWQIDQGEFLDTYKVTHSLSAKGRRGFIDDAVASPVVTQAWENAKEFVLQKLQLGYDPTRVTLIGTGVNPSSAAFPNYPPFNYVRTQTVDELGGIFSATENWILSSGNFYEDFTVTTKIGQQKTSVNIDGTITGFSTALNDFSGRFSGASDRYNSLIANGSLLARGQAYGYPVLNPLPVNYIVAKNPVQGTITYSYEYDTRPVSCLTVGQPPTKTLSEKIVVTDYNQGDVFAEIPVIRRAIGPVLQSINTLTAKRRQITIEALFPVPTGLLNCSNGLLGYLTKPDSETPIISVLKPSGVKVFRSEDRESWDYWSGAYSRDVSFTYET